MTLTVEKYTQNQTKSRELQAKIKKLKKQQYKGSITAQTQRRQEIQDLQAEYEALEAQSRALLSPAQKRKLQEAQASTPAEEIAVLTEFEKNAAKEGEKDFTGHVGMAVDGGLMAANVNDIASGKWLARSLDKNYLFRTDLGKAIPEGVTQLHLHENGKNALEAVKQGRPGPWKNPLGALTSEGRQQIRMAKSLPSTATPVVNNGKVLADEVRWAVNSSDPNFSIASAGKADAAEAGKILKVADKTTRYVEYSGVKGTLRSGFTRGNVALAIGTAALETGLTAIDDYQENGELTRKTGKSAIQAAGGAAGGLLIAGAAAKAGAAIGTCIGGPLGTAVGFVIGAGIGYVGFLAGSWGGKKIADATLD